MLIGVISDSHDDMEAIKLSVELFNSRGVGAVVHAGDFVSPFTFDVLSGLKAPLRGVFGNNDGDKLLLAKRSEGAISEQPLLETIGGIRVAVVHEPDSVEALAQSGDFQLVIYGHTHVPDIRTVGQSLVLNPGKAARLHKGKASVAIVDTDGLGVEVIEL